ncbi:LPXTG cell wall anchor domain-containing protein [Vagococcus sp. BWB3-3]|uniref:LPXTG cell wall anchor domain-containing protein n=1 Tax=Vagococcus allomyrinae TaxID=2794353 RepID=A0A940PHW9_9ENTE|nr:LPXTG cell wall anchor domain-containing protein [Vagococcus allomyrinae]MBP1044238.1 LPXTG cell wall anchor domain-containing protein [Vagococcus allomyrinae]
MPLKQRRIRIMVSIFCLLTGFFFGGASVLASTEVLPKGIIVGDDTGLKVGEDGKYFVEHTDIKPGLTFTKDITISNYAQKEGSYTLRMDMKEEKTSGAINLLEAITVKLELAGKVVYDGDLMGRPTSADYTLPIELGEYSQGETRQLKATFQVSTHYSVEEWEKPSEADFYWIFYATNESEPLKPSKKPSPKPKPPYLPQTGEEWRWLIIGFGIGLMSLTLSLYAIKRRQVRT